jgi:hypothetical protein
MPCGESNEADIVVAKVVASKPDPPVIRVFSSKVRPRGHRFDEALEARSRKLR